MNILNCSTSQETKIVFKKNKIYCDNKYKDLPKYTNIDKEIDNLIIQKNNIALKYFNILQEVLYNNSYEHKHLLDNFTAEINILDNKINNLRTIYNNININTELNNLELELSLIKNNETKLINNNDKNDILLAKELAKIHKKKYELFLKIKNLKNTYMKNITLIEQQENLIIENKEEKPKIIKNNNFKILNDKEKNVLNSKIKEKLFKFKNIDECASKKRTMTYYMSRQDIIDIIDKDIKIKKLMPSNYKTLAKEDLCKYIDKL